MFVKNRSFSTFAISSKIHAKITQISFMVSIKQKNNGNQSLTECSCFLHHESPYNSIVLLKCEYF